MFIDESIFVLTIPELNEMAAFRSIRDMTRHPTTGYKYFAATRLIERADIDEC